MEQESSEISVGRQKESAITWRSFSALLFAAAVVQPLIVYLTLVGSEGLISLSLIGWGGGFGLGYSLAVFTALGGQILWIVVILWSWIARSFGRELTVGETFTIFAFYPVTVGTAILFVLPIFRLYVANTKIVEDLGLSSFIPSWWAPRGPEGLLAYGERSLVSTPMLMPTLLTIAVVLLTYASDLSLGLFAYQRYAQVERLDFPAASTYARGILVLTGAEPRGRDALMSAAAIGILYGIFSWLLPHLTGIGVLQLFPRGITDLTYLIEGRNPGSSFGINLAWMIFASGFVVPLKVLVTMAASGIAAYTVANTFLVRYGIWPDWAPGYGLGWNFARSNMYWWTSVTIGLALAATFVPMILRPKDVIRIFKPSRGETGQKLSTGMKGGYIFFVVFLASSGCAVLLFHLLVPEFPILLSAVFIMGWSFFATMVAAHASGVTFRGMFVPYSKEFMIYYSGYTDPAAWFGKDFMMLSQGGGGHAGNLKMAQLLGVNVLQYVKGFLMAATIGLSFGFFYASIFWQTAPIPSYIYRFTLTGWPIMATETTRWTKWLWTGVIFKTDVILGSAAIGAGIVAASSLLGAPWLLISIVAGLNTLPAVTVFQLAGGVLGWFMSRRLGARWREIAPLVIVGIALGDGAVIALGSAASIIGQSVWSLPY